MPWVIKECSFIQLLSRFISKAGETKVLAIDEKAIVKVKPELFQNEWSSVPQQDDNQTSKIENITKRGENK